LILTTIIFPFGTGRLLLQKKKNMIGKLDNSEIEEVLRKQIVGRLGCHAHDTTYIVPISYAYDGTYIYGHTYDGMKIKMMRENPEVCFEVDIMENMANWKSVIAWGEFEELTDPDERKKGIQELLDRTTPIITSSTVKITPQWPFSPSDLNKVEGIVYRIKLNKKTGRFEKNGGGSYYAT
jgi:nitroimidazol reductase NimA-like FMN-containing flavoprotein (pyridoxamine 5'-phosphate oxidase superfamily)